MPIDTKNSYKYRNEVRVKVDSKTEEGKKLLDEYRLGGGDSDVRFRMSPGLPVFVHDTNTQVRCAVEDLLARISSGEVSAGTGRKIMDLEQSVKYPEVNETSDCELNYFRGI